jgi:hypothetical protein
MDSGKHPLVGRPWPELGYEDWRPTRETLHRYLQIIGKVRLSKSPWINHSWQSSLYLTARGLTTSLIHDVELSFTIELDFIMHRLRIESSDGRIAERPLESRSVAWFYSGCLGALAELGIQARICRTPNELPDRLLLSDDEVHRTYDPESARRFWQVLLNAERVMTLFRSRFIGKTSPVHVFWGSLDLASTRFSGRRAPEHPGGVPNLPDLVVREAYSHEVSSCGFWSGDERFPRAAFYSYAYPEPSGFSRADVGPWAARYDEKLREFVLPYDAVRASATPEADLLEFFQSSYEAAADLGGWDRHALEDSPYLRELQKKAAA